MQIIMLTIEDLLFLVLLMSSEASRQIHAGVFRIICLRVLPAVMLLLMLVQ